MFSKLAELASIVLKIYTSKPFRLSVLKISLSAVFSSVFMILGFITAVKGVQFLVTNETVDLFDRLIRSDVLYIPCAVLVLVFFSLSGELKYRQEISIERFKMDSKTSFIDAVLHASATSDERRYPVIDVNPMFNSDDPSVRMRAFSLVNGTVARTLLGLTNIIPAVSLQLVVGVVLFWLSPLLTMGIIVGVAPVAIYLILIVKKKEDSRAQEKKVLEEYNFGVRDYFKDKIDSTELRSLVLSEYSRLEADRLEQCKREYVQSYWANISLFAVVGFGFYAIEHNLMDLASLVLYVLGVRWFISSTIRVFNNAHTIGISRDGCTFLLWSAENRD